MATKIKDSIFQVLYLILKEEDDSFLSFAIDMGAGYLQMAAFAFDNQVSGIWKAQDYHQFVFYLFSCFQVQTYFPDAFTNFLIPFYIIVAVLVLIVINILYVSIAFSNSRLHATWPILVLRAVPALLFTFLFLPITETFISMLECSYYDGDYVLSYYPEVKCFQGAHIMHATIAIIAIIVFVTLGFIYALTYFEIRMLSKAADARQHSRGDVMLILNKTLLQFSFFFFPENQWLLVLVITGGALLLWHSFYIREPYHRKECMLFSKITTTYYLWTALLLFISKFFEDTSFDGGLVIWFIGLPFIGVILAKSKFNTRSLLRDTSRFKTSQDLMNHLRSVLQLIDIYDNDKNARILLTQYIEKHQDTCEEEDCPLKANHRNRNLLGDENEEIKSGLIMAIDRMYQNGLREFNNSANLRIAYAVFLIERLKEVVEAEEELAIAKDLNPSFEDEFIIFRLTKMIADQ